MDDTAFSQTHPSRKKTVSLEVLGQRPIMRDRCGRLNQAWYAALLSEQLKTKPVQRAIMQELIVLFRDKQGQARALLDRCPHRNALLSEGQVHDGIIACPYHGWSFNGKGERVAVPAQGPKPGCLSTESFWVREQDGIVWVWMGPASQEPQAPPHDIPLVNTPGYGGYYMETLFPNNVTNLVENFMDVPHTVFVHKGWFRSAKRKAVRASVERTDTQVKITYHDEKDEIGFSDRILNPKGLKLQHTDLFIMPNQTQVDYIYGDKERHFSIVSTCTPIDDQNTRVFTRISYKLGAWTNRVARLGLPWYTRRVIQQDVTIMEIQARALGHYGESQFSATSADLPHQYIESLRERAQLDIDHPPLSPRCRDITMWI